MQLLLQGLRSPLPICGLTAVAVPAADVDTEQSAPIGVEEVAEAGVDEALDLKPKNTLEEAKSRERRMMHLPTPSSDAFQGNLQWAPQVPVECFQSQFRSSITLRRLNRRIFGSNVGGYDYASGTIAADVYPWYFINKKMREQGCVLMGWDTHNIYPPCSSNPSFSRFHFLLAPLTPRSSLLASCRTPRRLRRSSGQ
jgi:hypothetical protein